MIPGLFRAVQAAFYPREDATVSVYTPRMPNPIVLDAFSAQTLGHCRSFKSLRSHAETVARHFGWPVEKADEIASRLASLVDLGLLIRSDDFIMGARQASKPSTAAKVAHLAVPTRNRTSSLASCMSSYVANAKEYGRKVTFHVADASDSEAAQKANEDALNKVSSRFNAPVLYCGRHEGDSFQKALVSSRGFPNDVVEFALRGPASLHPAPGANRNLLLLHLAGTVFASVDDDTQCCTAPIPDSREDAVSISSDLDPTEFWFPTSPEWVIGNREHSLDYLGLHEEYLGRTLSECVAKRDEQSVDLDRANDELLLSLADGTARVCLTQTGLRGDVGMVSPPWLMLPAGPSYERLVSSEAGYQAMLTSRQVIRGVRQPTITSGTFFMTYSVGMDNRALLPPFFPVLRNSDGLFSSTLDKCSDDAAICHLPWTVLHDPPEPRTFMPEDIWKGVGGVRFATLLASCIGSAQALPTWDRPKKLRAVGRYLLDLAALPPAAFEELVRPAFWRQAIQWTQSMERRLKSANATPHYWARDVKQAIRQVDTGLREREFILPTDVIQHHTLEEAMALTQKLLGQFGSLLTLWPDLVEASKELAQKGDTAFRRI